MPARVINIVVAAGSGSRFGSLLPKQFCMLRGQSVLDHAIGRLNDALPESTTVAVLAPQFMDRVSGHTVVSGGATRWESVKNAIDATADIDADVIIVHDGARPLPSAGMIRRVVAACREHHGAIPVVAVTDSLRHIDGTPANRADFCAVQTPQAFRADLLRRAYDLAFRPEFTDDASVMTAAGFSDIAMVEGDPMNIKITHPADIEIAEIYLTHGA